MSELIKETSAIIQDQRHILAKMVVDRQYEQHPQFWEKFGEGGRELSVRDVNYHISYLIESIRAKDVSLFGRYTEWVAELFSGLGFPDDTVTQTLECMRAVFDDALPEDLFLIVDTHIKEGLRQSQKKREGSPSYLDKSAPLYSLTKKYLDALLAGQKHKASRLILEAVEKGTSIRDIYLEVFQRSQYEIGRLWCQNKISVAQEHYSSAATQLIMSQLYPHIFAGHKIGRSLVAACVNSELHEIGIRMVADFFEIAGWDTYYMGANTPNSSIIQAIVDTSPHILALSATMPYHQSLLQKTIAVVRASYPEDKVKIIVGGYALNNSKDLWKKLGADGYAGNAEEAVIVANSLLDGKLKG
ncbi:MAG: cobalamin-dependent protein [Candidatus Aminicenantes bacterium]|jgi:methanogenic corrinoid protein MtbC1